MSYAVLDTKDGHAKIGDVGASNEGVLTFWLDKLDSTEAQCSVVVTTDADETQQLKFNFATSGAPDRLPR